MIKGIAHIGITVANISNVIKELELLGIPCNSRESFEEIGMDIAFCGNSKTKFELGEITAEDIDSFISKEAGIHHIALQTENIEKVYIHIKKDNRYTIETEIKQGAHGKVFFFRINSWKDILFECVE